DANKNQRYMAAWLDEVADKFVPVADHRRWIFSIAEYFCEGAVVYRTLRSCIVNHVQALPEVRLRAMRPKIHRPVFRYPNLAVLTVDHRWRLCCESQRIVFDRKLPFKQGGNLLHQ